MNILVAQLGARRHYAVPRALHAHGRLARFFTDLYLGSGWVHRFAAMSARLTGVSGLRRLAGRQDSTLPAERVRSFPAFGLEYKWRVRREHTAEGRTAAWLWGGQRFCQLVIRKIPEAHQDYHTVYAYTSAAKELFEHAREIGVLTCLDHATAPRRVEMALVHEEVERFPGWGPASGQDRLIDVYHQRQREELFLADVVICGSSFVRNMVVAEGVDPAKIRLAPLGISSHFPRFERADRKAGSELHVLFVGGDGLRKGIGYLARAVKLMASNRIQVRVAGDLEISEGGLAELRRYLDLLGPVPRTEIESLFRWADVLVLPSISDTFGLVVLEAMAAGLPVITTPHTCGPDVIREGLDGFIVPIRDPEAIADRLERLARDRKLLRAMSEQALERVRDFSIECYGERLVAATTTPFARMPVV